ncbi:hypothetical protein AhSzq1_102 [Aeromonas phage AhSzq-1]|uniref:Tail fiber protein n=1 Tax=Aeromonas phage AhSzq-1 TaxID=2138298 RepID=A0A2R4ALT7_9CAUD|nr:tail fiber protein [Aeromonas phage AhSzq-1]AVR75995.1 hypothetical protein AhSzq1_102 [Aeromonas phage AhSzq-1]
MSKEITLTEALATLKVLRAKQDNLVRTGTFVGVSARDKVGSQAKEVASAQFQSEFDRLKAFSAKIQEIGAKLYEANSKTTVVVAGKTYTLAEAIYRKGHTSEEAERIRVLKAALQRAEATAAKAKETAEKRADQQVETLLAGRSKDTSVADLAVEMRTKLIADEKIEVIDPNKLADYILAAEEDLVSFSTEVDVAISLVNATTKITVNI